jgi:hypothetical protein
MVFVFELPSGRRGGLDDMEGIGAWLVMGAAAATSASV